jgi:hypothetical protein
VIGGVTEARILGKHTRLRGIWRSISTSPVLAFSRRAGILWAMIAEISAAASAPHIPGKHWPRALRERVRLEWLAGNATLRQLAERYGIPFGTVKRWHAAGAWGELSAAVRERADDEAMKRIESWLACQRESHVRRVVAFTETLFARIQAALDAMRVDRREAGNLVKVARAMEIADREFHQAVNGATKNWL